MRAPAFAAALAILLTAVAPAQDPTRVLVVYSTTFPDRNGNGIGDSLEVAQHYAARRGVPAANLLGVACSTSSAAYDQIPGWTAFFDEVATPVNTRLQALGRTNIDVLLWCHGVPYQLNLPPQYGGYQGVLSLDDVMRTPTQLGTRTAPAPLVTTFSPYFERSPSRPPDLGRFDHALYRVNNQDLYLNARLDGVSADAVKDLVEGAIYGERYLSPQPGYYQGVGYVDSRFARYTDPELQGYPFFYNTYANADKCMAFGKFLVQASGYTLKWENTPNDLEIGEAGAQFHDGSPAQLAPDAMWYGGWYNYGRYLDVWTWLPGSAAIDLNSNSLSDVRSTTTVSFLTKAFQRGLTCGTGCITEPFLNNHPQPETFLYYLYQGMTFAEAASLCTPTIPWVNLAVGDPLYCPHRAGRVPVLDTTSPPLPAVRVAGTVDTQRTVAVAIDTAGREPDLVRARIDFGPTSAHGSRLDYGPTHRTRHDLVLDNLTPDALYHLRVTVRDPVGNTTSGADQILYTRTPGPLLAGVNPTSQQATAPALAFLDLTVGHATALTRITGLQLLVSAPHLNLVDFDLTLLLFPLLTEVTLGAGQELINLRIGVPTGVLTAGSYLFKLRVFDGSASPAEDTGTVTVQ